MREEERVKDMAQERNNPFALRGLGVRFPPPALIDRLGFLW